MEETVGWQQKCVGCRIWLVLLRQSATPVVLLAAVKTFWLLQEVDAATAESAGESSVEERKLLMSS